MIRRKSLESLFAASLAARRSLFVVPSDLMVRLRAEHTMAIRASFVLGLCHSTSALQADNRMRAIPVYLTTSSTMFSGNFPMLVPPNFCTIQREPAARISGAAMSSPRSLLVG